MSATTPFPSAASAASQIYLVQAESPNVPGIITKAFATEARAHAEAAKLVNIMLKENGWQPLAVPGFWQHHRDRLQEEHGDEHCWIEIQPLTVED